VEGNQPSNEPQPSEESGVAETKPIEPTQEPTENKVADNNKQEDVGENIQGEVAHKEGIGNVTDESNNVLQTKTDTKSPAFNYEVVRQTDKAVLAKVPYWEETYENKAKHKQLYHEMWIPKYVIDKGDSYTKSWVIQERDKVRRTNAYQNKFGKMPHSWNRMGEYAPEKIKQTRDVYDEDKIKLMRTSK
jgi:hypothetical protein